jgi:hypothetical protein
MPVLHRYRDVTNKNNAGAVVEEQKQVIVFTGMSINTTQVIATYTAGNNKVIRRVFNGDKLFSG